jgi:hypothetical protein
MIDLQRFGLSKRKRLSDLLGLSLDGSRLEGVLLKRTNGSLQFQKSFAATLSLDPLTNDPVLVGREIRNQLEAEGVRERDCVVGLPLKWILITHTRIPDLPEADVPAFLQIEAERGFPCDVSTLLVATSRYRCPSGENHATLIGIPRNHLATLEQVLHAAQLKPVAFSLGISALQPPGEDPAHGVLALMVGESHVALQVTSGGGVAALRAVEGAIENEAGQRQLNSELVVREGRITLGQMPAGVREAVRQVRVFGPPDLAQELARELQLRFSSLGLKIEVVSAYPPSEFGVRIPAEAVVSPAFSLAAWPLSGQALPFDFLPPKVSPLQQLLARYSSGTLQRAALAAGGVLLLTAGCFLWQQWQLWRLRSEWAALAPKVREVGDMQQKIRQFRPWFDESLRTLSVLRQLTEAFPEDGAVSAKTVEIRERQRVTCSGVARDNQALLRTLERLRKSSSVTDLKVDQIRGKTPLQFTFDFQWIDTQD